MPYHNYHVFNIWIRTGHKAIAHTLETMNSCRISWGKIIIKKEHSLIVESPQLIYDNNQISLSAPKQIEIQFDYNNQRFFEPEIGNFVSIHWNWACDTLSLHQVQNLIKYTNKSLQLANKATPIHKTAFL